MDNEIQEGVAYKITVLSSNYIYFGKLHPENNRFGNSNPDLGKQYVFIKLISEKDKNLEGYFPIFSKDGRNFKVFSLEAKVEKASEKEISSLKESFK